MPSTAEHALIGNGVVAGAEEDDVANLVCHRSLQRVIIASNIAPIAVFVAAL